MFLFKKLVSPFLYPVSLSFALLAVGLSLQWFTRRQKAGRILCTVGTLMYGLLGFEFVSDALLRPLEYAYRPVLHVEDLETRPEATPPGGIRWVVVLSSGHIVDESLPVTSQISQGSLVRLAEGIRLHRELPGSRLLLSGGGIARGGTEAGTLAKVAGALGLDPASLVLETESLDTKDQARLIQELVGQDTFLLVTSAYHMPRAVALFRGRGMHPIPAPTGHLTSRQGPLLPYNLLPNVTGLYKAERSVHEYLGLLWARLRGQI